MTSHAVAPQTYGAHAVTVPPTLQLPLPSHVFAVVWLPAEHDADAHWVLVG